jgi:diguanylate cyclase (GGDEF)-like protein/PAS domain S-box-containing protein
MITAAVPVEEKERLGILKKYDILDTEPEEAFEAMVRLASYICQTPIAAISLVDEHRQWFKAIVGLDAKETSRDVAFCAHTILNDGPMIVSDAQLDERFSDNPLVTSSPNIRFYAGIPLTTSGGYRLGTLCVIDNVPRELSQTQLGAVKTLADNVMAHLDLLLSHKQARNYIDDLQLAASIFDAASEAMFVSDAQNCIVTVNPAFTAITGYSLTDVIGQTPRILGSGRQSKEFYQKMWNSLEVTGSWKGELWNKRKTGEHYAQQLSINVIYPKSGHKRLHVAIFSDITHKKQTDELIWKQANYDHLTQLPNRMLFQNRLEQDVRLARRSQQAVSLLFIDLDRFKAVNDTMGHDVGDELLKQVASRIRLCVRETDMVARMGGDEFTILFQHVGDPIPSGTIAKNIIDKLEQPFFIHGVDVSVSASIGIASCPKDADNPVQLLKCADIAMYDAKESGRGRFSHFVA